MMIDRFLGHAQLHHTTQKHRQSRGRLEDTCKSTTSVGLDPELLDIVVFVLN